MQERIRVKVFPDDMSTGFWHLGGGQISIEELQEVIPKPLLVGFKYWHWIWEKCQTFDGRITMSQDTYNEWVSDGNELVEAMNYLQTKYQFMYEVARYKDATGLD